MLEEVPHSSFGRRLIVLFRRLAGSLWLQAPELRLFHHLPQLTPRDWFSLSRSAATHPAERADRHRLGIGAGPDDTE